MKPHHLAELNQQNRNERLTILNAARKYPGKYYKDIYREHLETVKELRLFNAQLNAKPQRKERSYFFIYVIILILILLIWIYTTN